MSLPISIVNISLILFLSYIIILSIVLLLDNRSPQSFLAWVMILILLPFVGAILYILVGKNWSKDKNQIIAYRPEEIIREYFVKEIDEQEEEINNIDLSKSSYDYRDIRIANTCLKSSSAPLTIYNNIKIYFDGKEYFDDLIDCLEKAQTHIHIETFILRSDEIGCKIKDILIKKVKQNVIVRIIVDGVGCLFKIKHSYIKELREAGVLFSYFHDPFSLFFMKYVNYRNHRKIIIIDGIEAFTGGMNIGLEYINGGKRFDSWRDTHIKVIGESVLFLQNIFLSDWYNTGGRDIYDYPDIMHDISVINNKRDCNALPMQILSSGPDSKWNSIHMVYSRMITEAQEYVYIQSPYFVPDEGIMHDLITASLSGVEILLMITGIPDKHVAWWAAHTYFEILLEAGVRIFLYKKGFLHSKNVIIDDIITSVGSCNMDIRSFLLHYEVNAVIYNDNITKKFKSQFIEDINFCEEITIKDWKKRNIFIRLRNSICRVISPLL